MVQDAQCKDQGLDGDANTIIIKVCGSVKALIKESVMNRKRRKEIWMAFGILLGLVAIMVLLGVLS